MRLWLVRIVCAVLGSLAVMATAAAHQTVRSSPSAPPFLFDAAPSPHLAIDRQA